MNGWSPFKRRYDALIVLELLVHALCGDTRYIHLTAVEHDESTDELLICQPPIV